MSSNILKSHRSSQELCGSPLNVVCSAADFPSLCDGDAVSTLLHVPSAVSRYVRQRNFVAKSLKAVTVVVACGGMRTLACRSCGSLDAADCFLGPA